MKARLRKKGGSGDFRSVFEKVLWKDPKDMHVFSSGKDENRQDWESWKSILF